MKDFYQKQAEIFMEKAAKLPPNRSGMRSVKGRSSLHQIIKTKEQADRFMAELRWCSEQRGDQFQAS